MGQGLQEHDFTREARCFVCGAKAVGPCASCHRPVCGDCSVLTDGGLQVYAICVRCDRRGGRSLSRAWTGTLVWLVGILVALGLVVWLLETLGRS